jgi:hypothetical protein
VKTKSPAAEVANAKSKRREGPVAIEAADFMKLAPGEPCTSGPDHAEADSDYYSNLKKFERHDDMSAPPTRKK